MARTHLSKSKLRFPINSENRNALHAKLAEHDDALDAIEPVNTASAAKLALLAAAPQALSGAGAITLTEPTTLFTSTGAGNALTLADYSGSGSFRKRIIHAVKGSSGTGVITAGAALHLGHSIASITFTNVRAWVDLEWPAGGTEWNVIGYGDVTFT